MSEKGIGIGKTLDPWKNFENIQAYDFSSINEITADFDENSPYEIFNLNGVKVSNNIDNLIPGIYILRQGKTVKKISVK